MYVMAAWVAAAAWLAGFGALAVAGRFPRRPAAGGAPAGPDGGPQPPALKVTLSGPGEPSLVAHLAATRRTADDEQAG